LLSTRAAINIRGVSTNQEIPYSIHEKHMLPRTEITMRGSALLQPLHASADDRTAASSYRCKYNDTTNAIRIPWSLSHPQQLMFVVQTTTSAALDSHQLSSGHQRRRYGTFLCAGAFRTLPSRQHYHHQQQQQEQREGTSDFMLYAEEPSNLHHPE
jgi:hypothetical protein